MSDGIFFRLEAYAPDGERVYLSWGGAQEGSTHVLGNKAYRALVDEKVEKVVLTMQPAAGATLDQAHRKAWIDCGCGYQSNVTWTAPTVSILKRELWDAGYSIWGRCEHL